MISRIQILKEFYGLSTRALAIKCGMNQPTLDRMLKGINALNLNCISSILSTFPDISAEWLMRGKGDMLTSDTASKETERLNKMSSVVETLQDVIDSKSDTIAALNERIKQLENQVKK